MSDARPIGVFDSGIGGLTVAKALQELLPNERIFYLGDTARVPYGNKSADTVERYSIELASMLIRENAKVIVVACNTVSSVAIPKLRAHVSVPVIGVIEPGAQAALATTRNRHIGVIGTRATIRSGAYENALRALNVHVQRAQSILVRATANRGTGSDHADVSITCRSQSRLRARFDNANHRDRYMRAQFWDSHRGNGVARDHDHFRVLAYQHACQLDAVTLDRVCALVPVRNPGRIAEIKNPFVRQ